MATGDSSVTSGNDVAGVLAAYIEHSPFAAHPGLRTEVVEADHVRLALPFQDQPATVGDVVQGLVTCKLG